MISHRVSMMFLLHQLIGPIKLAEHSQNVSILLTPVYESFADQINSVR